MTITERPVKNQSARPAGAVVDAIDLDCDASPSPGGVPEPTALARRHRQGLSTPLGEDQADLVSSAPVQEWIERHHPLHGEGSGDGDLVYRQFAEYGFARTPLLGRPHVESARHAERLPDPLSDIAVCAAKPNTRIPSVHPPCQWRTEGAFALKKSGQLSEIYQANHCVLPETMNIVPHLDQLERNAEARR